MRNLSAAYETYLINLGRVKSFVILYDISTQDQGRGRRDVQKTDILRAGVVFLHSTFEEYLRTIILQRKEAVLLEDESKFKYVLGSVAMCGDNTGRSNGKKYALSDLWDVKDKTILAVVKESLEDKVGYITFNDYSQIVASLQEINICLTSNHNIDRIIDNYIERRHKIVHQADKNSAHGRGYFQSASINARVLSAWITAVDELVKDIESKLPDS